MATLTKSFKISVPSIPNFIFVGTDKLSIADFSDAELKAIGKAWTNDLIKAAAEKRESKKTEPQPRSEISQ